MFQFAYRGTSGVARIAKIPVAGSQTLAKGDPVVRASGLIQAMAAGATAATVVGIMNQDADGLDAETLVEVILADDESVFKADYITAGTKKNFDAADLATLYDVGATTNYNKIDPDDSTGGSWIPVNTTKSGDSHVLVKLAPAQRDPIAN